MRMSITANGGLNSIEKSLKGLIGFNLETKMQEFLDKCGERGIQIAKERCGSEYRDYIDFSKEINGHTVTVKAEDLKTIPKHWVYAGKIKYENVSPIMLAEYGSGNFFQNYWLNDVTKETSIYRSGNPMPNANKSIWYWQEEFGGEKEYSSGEEPTMPMFNSYMTLMDEINEIADSVFGKYIR